MRLFMKNVKGSTLLMVLVVLVIVIIFSVTALTIGSASTKQAYNQEMKLQAYYLARSGTHAVASYIVDNPDNLSDSARAAFVSNLVGKTSEPFKLKPDDEGEISTTVTKPSDTLLVVSSTATVGGMTQTVSVDIHVEKAVGMVLTKAAYASGNIKMTNGIITGDIFTSANISFSGGAMVNGDIYTMPDSTVSPTNFSAYSSGVKKIETEYPSFPTVNFPNYPDKPNISKKIGSLNVGDTSAIISSDTHYIDGIFVNNGTLTIQKPTSRVIYTNRIVVGGNGKISDNGSGSLFFYVENDFSVTANNEIIFTLGDEDINIVVNKLELGGKVTVRRPNGKKGRLNLYVKDEFKFNYGYIKFEGQKEGDAKPFNLYYGGTSKLTLASDISMPGLVQVKQAEVELGGGSGITGSIITGGSKVTIKGDTNITVDMIYAPNAAVTLTESGKVKGSIISNSLLMEGGARLDYKPLSTDFDEWTGGSSDKTTYKLGNWH